MTHRSPDRLAVVLSHPTQYYSPWFRWLRRHTGIELRVFYLWDFGVTRRRDPQFGTTFEWDVDLLSGYEHEFVPNVARDPGTHHFGGLRNPALTRRLAAWRPTTVLFFGYKWDAHLRAIAWARRRRLRLLFRGDSHFLGRGAPAGFRRMVLRQLYAQFDHFLAVGAANTAYFEALGVASGRISFAPHAVNDELFNPARADHHASAAALRTELRIEPKTRVVLFAGKLTAAKQPRELLAAFLALRPRDAALVFVGEGPEKPALLECARAAPAGQVHFLPFANQTEMPSRYLLADLLALPSRGYHETWGLAVNEAMHLGVPALVSDLVGCQRDLVIPGETGWVFHTGAAAGLREQLAAALMALAGPGERERLRRGTIERVRGYTYERATAGLLRALGGKAGTR